MYDVTQRDSLDKAQHWMGELRRFAGSAIGGSLVHNDTARALPARCSNLRTCTVHTALQQVAGLQQPRVQLQYAHGAFICVAWHAIKPNGRSGPIQTIPTNPCPPAALVLVANKTDLAGQRQVTEQEGQDTADRCGA